MEERAASNKRTWWRGGMGKGTWRLGHRDITWIKHQVCSWRSCYRVLRGDVIMLLDCKGISQLLRCGTKRTLREQTSIIWNCKTFQHKGGFTLTKFLTFWNVTLIQKDGIIVRNLKCHCLMVGLLPLWDVVFAVSPNMFHERHLIRSYIYL